MTVPPFILLFAIPLAGSPLVYILGRAAPRVPGLKSQPARLVALALLIVAAIPLYFTQVPSEYRMEGITLRFDGLAYILSAVTLALGILVTWYSSTYMRGESGEEKYYAMLTTMIGTIIGLGCAADLFNLWLWFEAMAVSSYLLVAFYRERKTSLEAGVKYLVQSATGSVLVLIGVALVLALTGTLDLAAIHQAAANLNTRTPSDLAARGLLAAGALFFVGFGVKAALVPLHTWLPDAHAEAPSGISAMLSGVVIEAGLFALLRVVLSLAAVTPSWSAILLGMGALNMLVGNLLALRQVQVKRLLAFSSVAQVGYILFGIGISLYDGQIAGAQGGLFHFLNHGLMKGLAFLSAGALLFALYSSRGDHRPLTIPDLAGAAQRYPLAAFSLSIAVLGLGGLPPLAGFMSKWQILVAGFQTNDPLILGLVVFAAANSVLSLAYYTPLVNAIYRVKPSPAVVAGKPLPFSMSAPLALLGIAVIVIGVAPWTVDWLTGPAGQALIAALKG